MDHRITRNRTTLLRFVCTDNGAAWNLTGKTLKFTAKYNLTDSDEAKIFGKTSSSGITVTDAPGGLAEMKVNPADTDDIPTTVKQVFYDLIGIDGTDVWLLERGRLLIELEVLNTVP